MKMIKEFLEYLRGLIKEYLTSRIFPLTILMIVLFSLLVFRLFKLQIKEGDSYNDSLTVRTEKTLSIPAIRGKIYDVNGKLLAYNKITYTLTFGNDQRLSDAAEEKDVSENILKNQVLSDTIKILNANGDKLDIDFEIAYKNGRYSFNISGDEKLRFLRDVYAVDSVKDLKDEERDAKAEDVIKYLSKLFEVSDSYDPLMAYEIIACRYKLWLNRFKQYVPVNIASDISEKSRAAIEENQDSLYGMNISVKSQRIYNDAIYFSNIIGYVGDASSEDIEYFNSKTNGNSYKDTSVVGKMGVERVFETDLQGIEGEETLYVDNLGKVLETKKSTSAIAGNDIYLTIDADLTKYCYDMLEKEIASILLRHIENIAFPPDDNKDNVIAITDVYAALFSNNQINIENMALPTATEHEKNVYQTFLEGKKDVINSINLLLTDEPQINYDLSKTYQAYMEYICELLGREGLYNRSLVDESSKEFTDYVNGNSSLKSFLQYLISVEAIDVSSIEEQDKYYDSDEIYNILVDYIVKYLDKDETFGDEVITSLIREGSISGDDVVNLLYEQHVLLEDGDAEYASFKNGEFGAYSFMLKKITKLDITPAMLALAPCSGSIIVTDPHNGEVRALVSYPGFDNNKLTNQIDSSYYSKLLKDKTAPFYNKATMMRTAPGSTFKIVSTVAGVNEGVLGIDEEIKDMGIFDKVYTKPRCWIYASGGATHGTLTIPYAIDNSCNYFYYEVGYRLASVSGTYDDSVGLAKINKYATEFGLDSTSGIELDEISPNLSDNDAVTTAIGQGHNLYAPVQLARYANTIANSGTAYDLTLLNKVTDYEGQLIREGSHTVHSEVNVSESLWNSIHQGMRLVVTDDLKSTEIINGIKVEVAGKTGTAQESEDKPEHGLFISYAPYSNPEVAVTTVIQNGYNSANAAELTGFIYAYLYDKDALTRYSINGNGKLSD